MDFLNRFFRKKNKELQTDLSRWKIPFEKDSDERLAFEQWIENGSELKRLMSALKREYGFYLSPGEEYAGWVDFLNTDGANGILIHTQKADLVVSNWLFVAEFMKDRVLSWGYKLYSSSKLNADVNRKTTLFRHYLKPPLKNILEPPVDQIFGNVSIELSAPDSKKETLKIQIQHYNDRSYKEARNIEDLYYSLFNQD
jgi:hypothetical protein